MFILFILSGIVLFVGSFYSLFKWEKNEIKDTPESEYLLAKEIFVRDPEAFKDKDHDGIDDIIDQNVK